MKQVKQSHLAGNWYEGSASRLERQINALLEAADQGGPRMREQPPVGVVVPHAGYVYSGATAAVAYSCLRAWPYRRAVILAPSHFVYLHGAATLAVDAFATPLGEVAVDRPAQDEICTHPLVQVDERAYRREHALEIQLPLLQRVLPQAAIVPLLLGTLAAADLEEFAGVLQRLAGPHTIFIVSSDFTHYGAQFDYLPFPANNAEQVRERLRALDLGAIEHVLAGDLAGFRQYVADTGITICGRVPISTFLAWHGRGPRGQLLAYTSSLELTGDFEHSVSYAALAFA